MKILNERLDALERDNIEDEEAFNESDLYDEDEDVAAQLFINRIGSCGSTKTTKRNFSSEISVFFVLLKIHFLMSYLDIPLFNYFIPIFALYDKNSKNQQFLVLLNILQTF